MPPSHVPKGAKHPVAGGVVHNPPQGVQPPSPSQVPPGHDAPAGWGT
jgi:hypothetical protein